MTEQYPTSASYDQRLFEHYMGRPEDTEKRAEYVRRGLIPTNNLNLLIVDEPAAELAPGAGIPNPHDYRQKPYGHILEDLKTNQPEVWEQAKEVSAQSRALMSSYWDTISGDHDTKSVEAKEIAAQCEATGWAEAEVYTCVMQILAPQLEAEGFDPLEICG
jgi:hypothetical protein